MKNKTITIGTRGSRLALIQAEWVRDRLTGRWPGLTVELLIIKTRGDKILDVPLAKVGGKALFVKEIEDALLDGRADLAVHSMKDVPSELPPGLVIAAVPEREDPRDALVSSSGAELAELPRGAVVGTSSLRRQAQLLHLRPDFRIASLRGNVDTRLRKLDDGEFDAVILAAAGLARMGYEDRITRRLDSEIMLPAAGQGALGLEVREGDERLLELVEPLHHEETAVCVAGERGYLGGMGGGCQTPLAAASGLANDRLNLTALVADPDAGRYVRDGMSGPADRAAELGRALARTMLDRGGREILNDLYAAEEAGAQP